MRRALLVASAAIGVAAMLPPGEAQRLALPEVVLIDAGWFWRGSSDEDLAYAIGLCEREWGEQAPELCRGDLLAQLLAAETPQRRIWLSAYRIDRTEVTHERWRRCVAAGRCPPARTDGDPRLSAPAMPVAGVDFFEAERYCAFAGGRLPTEAQWERAARGADRRRFPWGQQFNDRLANHRSPIDGFRYLAPVGSFPAAASPHGLFDMAGNVWEWTRDRFDAESYSTDRSVDPEGPATGGERVTRGGSWRSSADLLRTTLRRPWPAGSSAPDLGLRCVYDALSPQRPGGGRSRGAAREATGAPRHPGPLGGESG